MFLNSTATNRHYINSNFVEETFGGIYRTTSYRYMLEWTKLDPIFRRLLNATQYTYVQSRLVYGVVLALHNLFLMFRQGCLKYICWPNTEYISITISNYMLVKYTVHLPHNPLGITSSMTSNIIFLLSINFPHCSDKFMHMKLYLGFIQQLPR